MIAEAAFAEIVALALREDLLGGDLTTEATVPSDARAVANAVARETLIVCGAPVFRHVFAAVDPSLSFAAVVPDGQSASRGAVLWTVRGSARSILAAERTALNFAQRMSGVATLTRRFVEALPPGSKTRIADTRKTTPGLRALDRYAVRTGGGHNHRDSLGSAVLIKENHIATAGGTQAAIRKARERAPHTSRLEVEVESLPQLEEALDAGADIVMLDDFSDSDIAAAVKSVRGRAIIEVSGGVTLERVPTLAGFGVDVISVGALTHSARAADIALEVASEG